MSAAIEAMLGQTQRAPLAYSRKPSRLNMTPPSSLLERRSLAP
jgi:hypothetical protein